MRIGAEFSTVESMWLLTTFAFLIAGFVVILAGEALVGIALGFLASSIAMYIALRKSM